MLTRGWRRSLRLGKREWHRTVRIENGWNVRMDFWFWDYKAHNESNVNVSLIAYRGPYLGKWTWRKEGHAIGPGGLAVASAALKLLGEVEQIAPSKAKHDRVWMVISGASLTLYLLYRRLLAKRGYSECREEPGEYDPYMIKELR